MTDIATLARSIHELWNDRDFDKLEDLTASDAVVTVVGTGESFHGPEGARQYSKAWADAFPDGRLTIDRVVTSDPFAVVEFTGRGTHTGTLTNSMGSIPATGRSLTLQLCDVLEFKDGKIISQHTYFDSGSLMAQLGVTAEKLAATSQ